MPRVLIVEDERMTRETLRTLVPWARLGVDEVETARDGVDALEKAQRHVPDLLVCDVRMPRLGGIECAQRIRERNPDCGIIFLSGYSDKEYLKAAIRLHAADYIDKPLNLEEIGRAVERNVRALRERQSTSAEAERARRVLTDLEPLLRASFAEELCRPGADLATVGARHDPRVAAAFLAGPLRVALAEVDRGGAEGTPAEARLKEAVRIVNQQAAPPVAAWLAAPDRIGLVAAGDEVRDDRRFEVILSGMAPAVEQALGDLRLRFGLGVAARSPEGAAASCAAAAAALEMRFYDPAARFLHPPAGAAPASPALDEGVEERLRAALEAGELEGAALVLCDVAARAERLRHPRTAIVGEAYARLLRFLLQEARGWEPAEVRVEQERMLEAIRAQRTLAELSALAEATLRRCFAPGSGGAAADRRIARIKEFVRTHHPDPDLRVETIAAGVGLSQSYLCTVFKQACGITVKDWLTQVRIDRAKQLLHETSDKLQAVALQVGFRDANYFSTVFKREVGITPREYRERSLR